MLISFFFLFLFLSFYSKTYFFSFSFFCDLSIFFILKRISEQRLLRLFWFHYLRPTLFRKPVHNTYAYVHSIHLYIHTYICRYVNTSMQKQVPKTSVTLYQSLTSFFVQILKHLIFLLTYKMPFLNQPITVLLSTNLFYIIGACVWVYIFYMHLCWVHFTCICVEFILHAFVLSPFYMHLCWVHFTCICVMY